MYNLQKYSGISSRYTCPRCGRKHCFTLYVNERGEPLHETVGRCDHSSSCGYHYTPKEYYVDHPDKKPGKDWRYEIEARLDAQKPRQLCTIPGHLVTRSISHHHDSDLITFLRTILDPFTIDALIDDYRIGLTRSGATIFFQIDINGNCRTGKIMKYNPETGHRIKDPDIPGRITWVHSLMKQSGQLPADWTLTQCLFGEHLLPQYPDLPVAIVESEKTAIICAGLMPKYLWLATGGKSCVNDRLLVLKGRKVIAFPDIDGFQEWTEKLSKYPQLGITVSPILQQHATAEDLAAHIDIADWLIRYYHPELSPQGASCHSERSEESVKHSIAFLKSAKYITPEKHEALENLINELDLEFVGVEETE